MDDGFLAIDLNNNGKIDDSSELFGSKTVIQNSGSLAASGYHALTQYDALSAGGNFDGHISKDDAIWSSLLIWQDKNIDGVSSEDEIFSLNDFNIVDIEIVPYFMKNSKRLDGSGNHIPYWSWVTTSSSKGPNKLRMADISSEIPD